MTELSIRQIHTAAVRILASLIVVLVVVAAAHLGAGMLEHVTLQAHVTPPGLTLR